MTQKNIIVVVGTRPEAIKLAPVIQEIQRSAWAKCQVVLTGQHRDLVEPILRYFDLQADHDLGAMIPNQTLAGVTARILQGFDALLREMRPAAVIGQGDTASVLAASMASFFQGIPFAHIEAGLRTGNLKFPFPEEMNRVLTTRLATWHFAPTDVAYSNLLAEGIPVKSIWVTGNTVIDALKLVLRHPAPPLPSRDGRDFVLITAHRRENLGGALEHVCMAIRLLAHQHPELDFIFPVHPNPGVRAVTSMHLVGVDNILLIEPCDYPVFCWLMNRSKLILSDSGGVQEEAPALGKPVLVLRDETERPEAVAVGATKLVGTDPERIVKNTEWLLSDRAAYQRMASAGSPYGDGNAAKRIVEVLRTMLTAPDRV
jgi:UDP-N-acetylglucosamine 2-epimerase (non-hydrolysing)